MDPKLGHEHLRKLLKTMEGEAWSICVEIATHQGASSNLYGKFM